MILNNVEKFPTVYGYPTVAEQLNRLWDLIWANGGESNWYRSGDRQFEVFVEWWCNRNKFSILSVDGKLPTKYKIKFCGGTMELIVSDRYYQFYDKPNYGSFSIQNSIYLHSGSACYSDRWADEPVDEFIDAPFVNFNGRCNRKKWLMTDKAVAEVVTFLTELCDRIEEARNSRA